MSVPRRFAAITPPSARSADRPTTSHSLRITGSSIGSSLWHLAHHPAALEEVQAELAEVLGGRLPAAADCRRLPALDRAVNEAMRQAQEMAQSRLGSVAGGLGSLGIPGL